jgi:hypothetical protein
MRARDITTFVISDLNEPTSLMICWRQQSRQPWKKSPGDLEFTNDDLRKTLDLQNRAGWEAAFAGCWAKGWAKEQDWLVLL